MKIGTKVQGSVFIVAFACVCVLCRHVRVRVGLKGTCASEQINQRNTNKGCLPPSSYFTSNSLVFHSID